MRVSNAIIPEIRPLLLGVQFKNPVIPTGTYADWSANGCRPALTPRCRGAPRRRWRCRCAGTTCARRGRAGERRGAGVRSGGKSLRRCYCANSLRTGLAIEPQSCHIPTHGDTDRRRDCLSRGHRALARRSHRLGRCARGGIAQGLHPRCSPGTDSRGGACERHLPGARHHLRARGGEGESDDEAPPQGGASVRREPLRDLHLAEVLSRLLDLWERTPKAERAGLTLVMSSFLDLIGAQDGAADGAERGRTVAAVSWRVDRESDPDDSTDISGVVSPGTCSPPCVGRGQAMFGDPGFVECGRLATDDVQHGLHPVAFHRIAHAGEYSCLASGECPDFSPGTPRVGDAVAWDEAEIGRAFPLDQSVDSCLVRRDGFGEFDSDSPRRWEKNQIGPLSGLDAKREMQQIGGCDGREKTAGDPSLRVAGGPTLRATGHADFIGAQFAVQIRRRHGVGPMFSVLRHRRFEGIAPILRRCPERPSRRAGRVCRGCVQGLLTRHHAQPRLIPDLSHGQRPCPRGGNTGRARIAQLQWPVVSSVRFTLLVGAGITAIPLPEPDSVHRTC